MTRGAGTGGRDVNRAGVGPPTVAASGDRAGDVPRS